MAGALAHIEAIHGDPLAALEYLTLAIRNYHDSGNTTHMRAPLAVLVTLFDRLGRHESAATIAVSRSTPSPRWPPPKSAPRSPTCVMFWATRPSIRSLARA